MFYVISSGVGNNGILPTGLWAPGDAHTRTLNVTNTCTLNGWLTSVNAQETDGSVLRDALDVQIWAQEPPTNDWVEVGDAPLTAFLAGDVPIHFPTPWTYDGQPTENIPIFANGGAVDLRFVVQFPSSSGNQYQGLSEVVTFYVNGVQMTPQS